MSKNKLSGKYDRIFTAVVTPYTNDLKVDEVQLRKLLRYFMQEKFLKPGGAIVINPEAGELHYLSRKEKRRNVEIAMEECGGKVPVFAGVIDITTEDTVKVAIDAKKCGVDGIFVMPPMGTADVTISWNPELYPEVWIDMIQAQVDATDLPVIVHPVAHGGPIFGRGLPLNPTLKMCREIPNIVGWKMTYPPNVWNIIAKGLRSLDRHVALLVSAGELFHHVLADGYFDGTVSGSFNYAMEPMIDHINAWKAKDIDKANNIWNSGLSDLQEYVYSDYSRLHIRYKIATWLRGYVSHPIMRPPCPRPRKLEVLTLYDLLSKCKLNLIARKEVNKFAESLKL